MTTSVVDAGLRRHDERLVQSDFKKCAATLLFAILILAAIAWLRGPEYDEAYSLFLTAGHARPVWPVGVFTPGQVRDFYADHASLAQVARDLRAGDVHPPLYFWALDLWRRLVGPSWFAARLLSVCFAVAAVGVVGRIAGMAAVPVVPAMLAALLTYGFAYTGLVARGFALAQLLNVVGLALLLAAGRDRRQVLAFAAGVAFGAASFSNYLAIFTGGAAVCWLALDRARWRFLPAAVLGLAVFLPADAWFFLPQRGARVGQFTAFSWRHALPLLAKDAGATMFGGLPVYAGRFGMLVIIALAGLTVACVGAIARRWRPPFGLFAVAAVATPAGLILLGIVFHNTPIEIRYLAFSAPYLALLAANLPRRLLVPLLAVQGCAIAGLAIAPATMQPQGAVARAAARAPAGLVLVPFGNDGVGIPGPFIAAAPSGLRIALIGPDQDGGRRFAFPPYGGDVGRKSGAPSAFADDNEIILAKITGDGASRAAIAGAQKWFAAAPCWQPTRNSVLITVYSNRCAGQQP